jgi:hypothetical protein
VSRQLPSVWIFLHHSSIPVYSLDTLPEALSAVLGDRVLNKLFSQKGRNKWPRASDTLLGNRIHLSTSSRTKTERNMKLINLLAAALLLAGPVQAQVRGGDDSAGGVEFRRNQRVRTLAEPWRPSPEGNDYSTCSE